MHREGEFKCKTTLEILELLPYNVVKELFGTFVYCKVGQGLHMFVLLLEVVTSPHSQKPKSK
jgi:hypothetical protein